MTNLTAVQKLAEATIVNQIINQNIQTIHAVVEIACSVSEGVCNRTRTESLGQQQPNVPLPADNDHCEHIALLQGIDHPFQSSP